MVLVIRLSEWIVNHRNCIWGTCIITSFFPQNILVRFFFFFSRIFRNDLSNFNPVMSNNELNSPKIPTSHSPCVPG